MVPKIEDLRTLIAEKQAVVVVGAGLSIAATRHAPAASWRGLLESGLDWCEEFVSGLPAGWVERQRASLEAGDTFEWIGVASQIAQRLRGGEYRRWLEETIGRLKADDRAAIEALGDLGVPLATTNYDDLIEQVTGSPTVTWRDPVRIQKVLRGDERAVVHLHGSWREPESVVLGLDSYSRLLGDRAAQALQQALRATRSLVYVGCGGGIEDPNFEGWLGWARGTFCGGETYRHYRLARKSEIPDVSKQHLPEDRIFALSYGEKFEDLAGFLRPLAPTLGSTPAATPPTTSSYPPKPGLCLGRETEVRALVDHLLSAHPAPVPVLGGPGIGKSTVTLEALHHPEVIRRFGERRYFVRCDGARTADAVILEIARSIGVGNIGEGVELRDRVVWNLGRAPVILVLDNAETPWEAAPRETEELLAALAGVDSLILVASFRGVQRPLGLRWRESIEIRRVEMDVAREIFLATSGRKFEADPLLEPLLAELDGVALAITLMAFTAETAPSLEWLKERWNTERTAMLVRGDDRLTNLELSIEVSFADKRMNGPARSLIALLGLLPDGMEHQDLAELMKSAGFPAADRLVATGLAFHDGQRLRLLMPVRETVRRRHPPKKTVWRKAVVHYLEMAKSQGARVGRKGGRDAVDRLAPELRNLETVCMAELEDARPFLAFEAIWELCRFFRFSGLGEINLAELAVRRAREMEDSYFIAQSLRKVGDIAQYRSKRDRALACYEEARDHYSRIGDVAGQAACIKRIGDIALRSSEHEKAHEYYENARQSYEKAGLVVGTAACVRGLGDIALERSEFAEAQMCFEEARGLCETSGDILGEANCIQRLGDIARENSKHQDAHALYEEALLCYQEIGSPLGEATCIESLGEIALQLSKFDRAQKFYERALPLYKKVGSLLGEANCIQSLGDIGIARKDKGLAREHFERALGIYCRIGERSSIGWTQVRLARIAVAGDQRRRHVQTARIEWEAITPPRFDLLEKLAAEFPEEFGDPTSLPSPPTA